MESGSSQRVKDKWKQSLIGLAKRQIIAFRKIRKTFFFLRITAIQAKYLTAKVSRPFRQNSVMLAITDRDVGCGGVFGVVAENCISISSMSRSYLLSGCSEAKVWMQSVSCK